MENHAKPRRLSVTVKTAQEITGLSHSTLYELMNEGKIESCLVGRRRLIKYSSLEKLTGVVPQAA